MRSFQRWTHSNFGTNLLPNSYLQGLTSTNNVANSRNSIMKRNSKEDTKLLAAKKHSEAERRRRMRINYQYATLRSILPNIIKMDKASVLGETIQHVRELKKFVSELKSSGGIEYGLLPSGSDGLSLEPCHGNREGTLAAKAAISCEDKPELMTELARALRSVKGRVVKAEMVTVGGRTKTVLWVQGLGSNGDGGTDHVHGRMMMLKRVLKGVIGKRSSPWIFKKPSYSSMQYNII